MKKNIILCSLILFFGANAVFCQSETQELLEKLQKKYAKLKDATFEFSQTTKFSITKVSQTLSGTVKSKKKKYRIETENGLIITDGSSVWRYNPEKHQVLVDKYKDDPQTLTPDRVVEDATKEYYYVKTGTEKHKDDQFSIIKLTPKSESSSIKSLKLWIDEDALTISKIEMTDITDNTTSYIITSFTTNTELPDSLFKFTPPEGVEVIDLR